MNEKLTLWFVISSYWPDILFATTISMTSGVISYFRYYTKNKPRLFNLYECVSHVLSSCVAGFLVIMFGAELTTSGKLSLSPWIVGALVPIVGASAPKLLDLLNKKLINSAKVNLGVTDDHDDISKKD